MRESTKDVDDSLRCCGGGSLSGAQDDEARGQLGTVASFDLNGELVEKLSECPILFTVDRQP